MFDMFRIPWHSHFEHFLHVLDLLSGEFLELGVGVEDLHAGLTVLPLPLVQLSSPGQFGAQLRICVGGARLLLGAVLVSGRVQGHRVLGSLFYLKSSAELRRQLVRGHFQTAVWLSDWRGGRKLRVSRTALKWCWRKTSRCAHTVCVCLLRSGIINTAQAPGCCVTAHQLRSVAWPCHAHTAPFKETPHGLRFPSSQSRSPESLHENTC